MTPAHRHKRRTLPRLWPLMLAALGFACAARAGDGLPPPMGMAAETETASTDFAVPPPPAVNPVPMLEPALPPVTDMRFVTLGRITFESGKWELSDDAKRNLDAMAVYVAANPGASRLLLDGHTDWVGGLNYNDTLSDKRAMAVEDYLAGLGLDPQLIHWKGHGERAPTDENWTRLGRGRNRQVELFAVYLPQ